MKILELLFEHTLWNGRLFVLLAVIFSLIASIILFIVASFDIWSIAVETLRIYSSGEHPDKFHEKLVGVIIGAVDLYLIAIVMLIFSFGVYELFISKIDPAREASSSKILQIHSLDQLKDKLAKVILMVLIVTFFKKAMYTSFDTPVEMLYFALSIMALGGALFLMYKASGGNNK